MNDGKKELLRKLKALADGGVGGEKINAQRKLAALMKKYGIAEEELSAEQQICCEFKYRTETELVLLKQTIYKVTNEISFYGFTYTATGRKVARVLGCKCTRAQQIEIEFLFDFYKRTYKKDAELFLQAFIQKHQIFGVLKDGQKGKEVDEETLRKMMMLTKGMSDDQPLKQIEGGKGNGER